MPLKYKMYGKYYTKSGRLDFITLWVCGCVIHMQVGFVASRYLSLAHTVVIIPKDMCWYKWDMYDFMADSCLRKGLLYCVPVRSMACVWTAGYSSLMLTFAGASPRHRLTMVKLLPSVCRRYTCISLSTVPISSMIMELTLILKWLSFWNKHYITRFTLLADYHFIIILKLNKLELFIIFGNKLSVYLYICFSTVESVLKDCPHWP